MDQLPLRKKLEGCRRRSQGRVIAAHSAHRRVDLPKRRSGGHERRCVSAGFFEDRREHFIVEGAGHYGIFSGRRWREVVYPKVRDFFAANAEAPASAKPKKKSNVTPLRRKTS
ncbi:hypothetical protein SOM47_15070 [Stenotrophomonas sp. CFBP8980]|nr:hypothetical protein [Stenotrophomonas sp. CFBP8980]MDY1034848.1 hypothetical protein [Stenotrophomonas sp. CFBP8980]